MFGCGDKSSLISESVTEIRINIHLAREKPDNMTYARSFRLYYDYLSLSPSEIEIAPLHLG
jgi:hypothetical protein